ncbi:hypothetical protein MLD38_027662 [Melastoma candidum]|uniref:Uncharacterized protein n=1 Tax=Melastoma candidum TaxID=119954 RepID=A0ACB9P2B1_9MYRT|nr:hypothetical protein MLD38_027662 [Melastoma candidum]
MSAVQTTSSNPDLDKLTYEIFSILENKFLFGACLDNSPVRPKANHPGGKVRILSIDGGDPILAAKSLVHLESVVRRKSGDSHARIADYFDVAAGSGAGGVLAALLFTRGKDSAAPLFTAEDALKFLLAWNSLQGRIFRSREKAEKRLLKKVFRRQLHPQGHPEVGPDTVLRPVDRRALCVLALGCCRVRQLRLQDEGRVHGYSRREEAVRDVLGRWPD